VGGRGAGEGMIRPDKWMKKKRKGMGIARAVPFGASRFIRKVLINF
jgi:hypothetical protein